MTKTTGILISSIGMTTNRRVAKLQAALPSGTVTQMVETVSYVTNTEIVTQMVFSVTYPKLMHESFSLSDPKRALVWVRTNGPPMILFKLKYAALDGSVEGTYNYPAGMPRVSPLLDIESTRNVAWVIFADTSGLNTMSFYLSYTRNESETNLIHEVMEQDGNVFFDGARGVAKAGNSFSE